MIKSDIIDKLSSEFTQYPETIVADAVNSIMQEMTRYLVERGRIEIRGFGSFTVRYHASTQAHNPKTGEKLFTTPKYSPHFKPGKELRELVDASREE